MTLIKSLKDHDVSIFKFIYCLLLVVGVWNYSTGYDYLRELNGLPLSELSFYLKYIVTFFGFTVAVSLAPRVSTVILILSFFSYEFIFGSDLNVYSTNIAGPILLLIFCFDYQLITRTQFFKMILTMLSVAYLCSAISKAFLLGWYWFSGNTLSAFFIESNIFSHSNLKTYLQSDLKTLAIISTLVLAWETSFGLVLMNNKKIKLFYFISGLLFHILIQQLLGPNFFLFFLPAYLAFIPFFLKSDSPEDAV